MIAMFRTSSRIPVACWLVVVVSVTGIHLFIGAHQARLANRGWSIRTNGAGAPAVSHMAPRPRADASGIGAETTDQGLYVGCGQRGRSLRCVQDGRVGTGPSE